MAIKEKTIRCLFIAPRERNQKKSEIVICAFIYIHQFDKQVQEYTGLFESFFNWW